MSDCGFCVGSDGMDGEYPEFSEIRNVIAKKFHRCCECNREIKPGEKYQYYVSKFDGEFMAEKTCNECAEIRSCFSCGGGWPCFGELWNEMTEGFPALTTGCFDKLDTPEAKSFLQRRWMEWKGLAA